MRPLESKIGKCGADKHSLEREAQLIMTNEDALELFERRNHGLAANPPASIDSRIKKQQQEIRRNELAMLALQKRIPMVATESISEKHIYRCPSCEERIADTDSVYVYGDAPIWCPCCGQSIVYK